MWWALAVLVVSAYVGHVVAGRQPQQKPPEQNVEAPQVKEGWVYRRVYGTVWIDNPQEIGFKRIGKDAIRKGGGKK